MTRARDTGTGREDRRGRVSRREFLERSAWGAALATVLGAPGWAGERQSQGGKSEGGSPAGASIESGLPAGGSGEAAIRPAESGRPAAGEAATEGATAASLLAREEWIIDAHLHTSFAGDWQASNPSKLSGVDNSLPGLLREMDENQVAVGVTFGTEHQGDQIVHTGKAPNPVGLEDLERLARRTDRFIPIGGINPYRRDGAALRAVDAALRAGKIRGLKAYLGYYHLYPYDDAYKPFIDLAAKHKVPFILHTGDPFSPTAMAKYTHPLAVDELAVKHRDVNFVLAHLGEPWTVDAGEVVYRNPNVFADTSGFLVGGQEYFEDRDRQELLDLVVEMIHKAFGWAEAPERFLYGTDWPLVPMRPYIALMKRAVPEHHHAQFFRDNARRLFKLS